jgi:hypothetical protein
MSRRIQTRGRSPFEQPMPAHRRQHIHGSVLPMAEPRRPRTVTGRVGITVALACALYFAAQLLRPFF